MPDLVALPLADGRWLALPAAALPGAFAAAAALGLPGKSAPAPAPAPEHRAERWLDSRELAALTGIHDTTLEGWAKAGRIPCLRAGKALRFKVSEVEQAIRAQAG